MFEIVINFFGITVSVEQMLSSKQDTITILHFMNCWLVETGVIPPEIVSNYSKALLAAESRDFNEIQNKESNRVYFLALKINNLKKSLLHI